MHWGLAWGPAGQGIHRACSNPHQRILTLHPLPLVSSARCARKGCPSGDNTLKAASWAPQVLDLLPSTTTRLLAGVKHWVPAGSSKEEVGVPAGYAQRPGHAPWGTLSTPHLLGGPGCRPSPLKESGCFHPHHAGKFASVLPRILHVSCPLPGLLGLWLPPTPARCMAPTR